MRSGQRFFAQLSRSVNYFPRLQNNLSPSFSVLATKQNNHLVRAVLTAFGVSFFYSTASETSYFRKCAASCSLKLSVEVDIPLQERMFQYFSEDEITQVFKIAAEIAKRQKSPFITEDHLDQARSNVKYGVTFSFTHYKNRDSYAIEESIAIRQAAIAVVGILLGEEVYKISTLHNLVRTDGLVEFVPTKSDPVNKLVKELYLIIAPVAAKILQNNDLSVAPFAAVRHYFHSQVEYVRIKNFIKLELNASDEDDANIDEIIDTQLKGAILSIEGHRSKFNAIKDALIKDGFLRGSDIANLPAFRPETESRFHKR